MDLIEKIEELREELLQCVLKNKKINSQVVQKSVQLDELLNQYYRKLQTKKNFFS